MNAKIDFGESLASMVGAVWGYLGESVGGFGRKWKAIEGEGARRSQRARQVDLSNVWNSTKRTKSIQQEEAKRGVKTGKKGANRCEAQPRCVRMFPLFASR